jgi:hypothetical protein
MKTHVIHENAYDLNTTEMPIKIASREELIHLAELAELNNYNRQLKTGELAERLDPARVTVVKPFMLHAHAGGEPVAQHVRAQVYLPILGERQPMEGWLDIPMDAFDALRVAPTVSHES